ncbi:biopolymer transporter ExbB [Rhodothalassium salexigens]|uniref:Outer membrane transport energization protein ExbB n=1 Tax=Rhodothalassium salexigens DSM 2132 TaxID=1188247 RepID=A0A4R2PN60_RHOSA|nr:MotA/TolQ/ExbB proton channel family protein [Rhodothalassium salexigens]MBB4210978.1 biopolymer transport protein ExbB [Rhodothalassium salexigens DSM 2132]MBK1638709.1 biopolymer transporter ExbB [Rhodothalassium salexigens DSM 2132]MBK5910043.1 biopolymer transporter ExbB [Rhodothalassium salexigens]MBK5921548.1 biopolymer transporter ExbB [Rhodothalassium salexigens]TCP36364.1 outer membrane transport energization protein ExbB [Rhodothalassium salexigens DSM 2132]
MLGFGEALYAIRQFMDQGGPVLYGVLAVTFVMWTLILERVWYFGVVARRDIDRARQNWEQRRERKSWYAHKIRSAMISEVKASLSANVSMIKTLVATCPLVGLLGTVTGMIAVFDAMAVFGSGNARAMADGVSQATIPTMAGMVAALSGVFMSTFIERWAKRASERLEDSLTTDH